MELIKVQSSFSKLYKLSSETYSCHVMQDTIKMQIDWWSVGMLLSEMLTEQPPLTHSNRKKLQERIIKENQTSTVS
ncbi:hypothetical protein NC651_033804 [Populus alba x Populus x berolinensis]|nr:hypothetical protein NC651_033804 [Populus alba x Populus x berolinensis]